MAGSSEAAKKAVITKRERYGNDYHSKIAAHAGRASGRGYLGKLKDSGNVEALKEITRKGGKASASRTKKAKSKSAAKGWKTRRLQTELREVEE